MMVAVRFGAALAVVARVLLATATAAPATAPAATQPGLPTPLVVGINQDYWPYEFLNDRGQPDGFNVDMVRAVAGRMGLAVRFEAGPWAQVRQALENGRIHALAGMLRSPRRAARVDFTQPHLAVHYAVFIRAGHPDLPDLESLRGQAVLVERGSLMHDRLEDLGLGARIVPVASEPEALLQLAAGQGDCALVPRLQGLLLAQRHGLERVTPASARLEPDHLCFAVRRGDAAVRSALDEGLAIARASGEYETVYHKWFGQVDHHAGGDAWRVLAYVAAATAGLALLLLAALAWSWSLRRRVRQRTAQLQREIDERQRTEQALRRSEEEHRLLAQDASDLITRQDEQGRLLYVSPASLRLLGYRPDELLGRPVYDLIPPDHLARLRESVPHLDQAPDDFAVTFQARRKDGTLAWFESTCRLLRQPEGGAVRQVLAVSRDITVRRQVEESLRESRRVLSTLMDNLPGMAYRCRNDPQWTMEFISQGCLEMTGYAPHELELNRRCAYGDLIHPEDRDAVRRQVQAALAENRPFQLNYRIRTSEGREKWIWEQGRGVLDEQGALRWLEGLMVDMTQRRHTEQELRRRIELETMLARISSSFISRPPEAVHEEFDRALEDLGRFMGVDRSYVFEYSADGTRAGNTHEWCAAAIDAAIGALGDLPVDRFPWHMVQRRSQVVMVPAVAALPPEAAAEQAEWRREGIQSILTVPLRAGEQVIGFVGVDSVTRPRAWDADTVALLKIAGEMFANALGRKRAAMELRQSNQTLAALIDASPLPVMALDPQGRVILWSRAAEQTFGWTAEEALHRPVPIVPADRQEEHRALRARVLAGESLHGVEVERQRRDGSRVPLQIYTAPVRDAAGQVRGIMSLTPDITERKRAEQALRESEQHYRRLAENNRRLLSEVNHRVRNNLAGLLSLLQLSRARVTSLDEFVALMESRLMAMTRIHELLAGVGWASLDLRAMLGSLLSQVQPTAPHPAGVELDGPPVPISPRQVLPLAMSLLELFANSCKHGAHSQAGGRLYIGWRTRSQGRRTALQIKWREAGGPAIGQPVAPSLGTDLIRGFVLHELGGQCRLSYPPEGVDHLIEFLIDSDAAVEAPAAAPAPG